MVSLVVALVAAAIAWTVWRPPSQPLVRWTVQPGPDFVPAGGGASAILSPDGSRIVYSGVGPDGRRRL